MVTHIWWSACQPQAMCQLQIVEKSDLAPPRCSYCKDCVYNRRIIWRMAVGLLKMMHCQDTGSCYTHSAAPVVNSPIDSCDWSSLNHKIPLTGPKTNACDLLAASFSSSFMQAGNLGLFHHHVCRLGTWSGSWWDHSSVYQRGMSRRYRLFVFLKPAVFLRKKGERKKKSKRN